MLPKYPSIHSWITMYVVTKDENNDSVEMLNYKLNAQGGFTPTAVAPPMR